MYNISLELLQDNNKEDAKHWSKRLNFFKQNSQEGTSCLVTFRV